MRQILTRRKLFGRLASTSITLAAASEASAQTVTGQALVPAPPLPTGPLAARPRTAIGASLIGFFRSDGKQAHGSAQRKLLELPSIDDFGAVGDDRTDDRAAIQAAIDAMAAMGGGTILVPAKIYRIEHAIYLRSNVSLMGVGAASVLHSVNTDRDSAIRGEGDLPAPLSGISVRNLTVAGDARYTQGRPSVVNGSGIAFIHANNCDVTGVVVVGFSDGGISFHNGNHNSISHCRVEQTAQGVSFTSGDVSVTGNIAIGNRIVDTGQYNGLHLEGGFGGGGRRGEVLNTTLSGNIVTGAWEAGINIELAPYTSCVGNTVRSAGMGRTGISMGIKLYGSAHSAICGNTVTKSTGDAIVIGANSGRCSVEGNTTAGNGGSLLLTDSNAQTSDNVSIGINNFSEGDIRKVGNVSIHNRVTGFSFANHADPNPTVLDWYQEGRFEPSIAGKISKYLSSEGYFTRIGNIVHVALQLEWDAATSNEPIIVNGLPYQALIASDLSATLQTDKMVATKAIATIAAQNTVISILSNKFEKYPLPSSRLSRHRLILSGQYMAFE